MQLQVLLLVAVVSLTTTNVTSIHAWSPLSSSLLLSPLSSSPLLLDRRTCLVELIRTVALTTTTATTVTTSTTNNNNNNNVGSNKSSPSSSPPSSSSSSTSATSLVPPVMPQDVEITHRVFMDVRVSRTDGSTYVRDDLPNTFDNQVLFQRLTLGLYGRAAPTCVSKFLSYIDSGGSSSNNNSNNNNDDDTYDVDDPFPSYSRSTFPALDQETGLLMGGNIANLRPTEVGGSTALMYGARVLPATLWIETTGSGSKISHTTKGLLTHRNLEVLPNFGITTRSQPSLDATHTVFGCVLWDDGTLKFFRQLEDLPTYSVERPPDMDDGFGSTTGDYMKTSIFNAQREFFRGAAKNLGDDRVSKLYNGKLLRRMEVLQVGKL